MRVANQVVHWMDLSAQLLKTTSLKPFDKTNFVDEEERKHILAALERLTEAVHRLPPGK